MKTAWCPGAHTKNGDANVGPCCCQEFIYLGETFQVYLDVPESVL